jgi:HrpA-like RNA helicase
MSKMLIASPEFSCSQEVLTVVAMLSGVFLFYCINVVDGTDPILRSSQYLVTAEQPAERSR